MKQTVNCSERLIILLSFFSLFFGVFSVYGAASPSSSEDNFLPPTIQLQPLITSGLSNPVLVTHARDARLFIVEQNGRVRIYQNGALLPTPFLDITSVTVCCGEQGLLGLAFHPNYPATPYFYVHFTSDGDVLPDGVDPNPSNNILMRFEVSAANPNQAVFSTGKTLLVMPQGFQNHNGGMIEFGRDGYLYIAKGDGGGQNDPDNQAQNINSILGKILRIDVNQNVAAAPYHGIPPDNPFAGATPGDDRIFLYGLRNPWRFSFDRATGDLWIGDVGQGAREEIDRFVFGVSTPGANLGWRRYEGTFCTNINNEGCALPANYMPPVAEYAHTAGRCSITGGYVYRGANISGLQGAYLYADFCTGEIWALQNGAQTLLLDTPHNIASFGEDQNGELYVTSLAGAVYRINTPPTAASVTVVGRVTSATGRGLVNVRLILSGGNLDAPIYANTNAFGYYRFEDLPVGLSYVITAVSKRHSFSPASQTFILNKEGTNINFVAESPPANRADFR